MLPFDTTRKNILPSDFSKEEATQFRDALFESLEDRVKAFHKSDSETVLMKRCFAKAKPYAHFGIEIFIIRKGAPEASKASSPIDIRSQTMQSKALISDILKYCSALEELPSQLYKMKDGSTHYWSDTAIVNEGKGIPQVPKVVLSRDPMDRSNVKGITHTLRVMFFYH